MFKNTLDSPLMFSLFVSGIIMAAKINRNKPIQVCSYRIGDTKIHEKGHTLYQVSQRVRLSV